DPEFGTGGTITSNVHGNVTALGLAIQKDNKLVVAGNNSNQATSQFVLLRYTKKSQLDFTFGNGGEGDTAIVAKSLAHAVAIDRHGNIVAAGLDSGASSAFVLARYTPSGSLDSSFGTGGKVVTPVGGFAVANDVVIESSGEVIVAGNVDN